MLIFWFRSFSVDFWKFSFVGYFWGAPEPLKTEIWQKIPRTKKNLLNPKKNLLLISEKNINYRRTYIGNKCWKKLHFLKFSFVGHLPGARGADRGELWKKISRTKKKVYILAYKTHQLSLKNIKNSLLKIILKSCNFAAKTHVWGKKTGLL